MRVCFLDFDGVLNSHWFARQPQKREAEIEDDLDPESIANLDCLLDSARDLKVVVSSSWRIIFKLPELVAFLGNRGLKNTDRFLDVTPSLSGEQRGAEILTWLQEHPEVSAYVVLDDDTDMAGVEEHFVHINREHGLLKVHVQRALRVLQDVPKSRPGGPSEEVPGPGVVPTPPVAAHPDR